MSEYTITVNTDASFCPNTHAAGFAFWLSSSLGRVYKSGALKEVHDSGEAEMQAVANALHTIMTHPNYKGKKFSTIWINSDCTPVLGRIQSRSEKTVSERFIAKALSSLLTCGGLFLCRHVKAHTRTDTARSFVNHWCDVHARKAMREKRSSL